MTGPTMTGRDDWAENDRADHALADHAWPDHAWADGPLGRFADERWERMRRLRFASALTDLLMAQGVPDRAGRKERMEQRLRRDPQMLEALQAVHGGPWRVREDAFEPSYLTILAGI